MKIERQKLTGPDDPGKTIFTLTHEDVIRAIFAYTYGGSPTPVDLNRVYLRIDGIPPRDDLEVVFKIRDLVNTMNGPQ